MVFWNTDNGIRHFMVAVMYWNYTRFFAVDILNVYMIKVGSSVQLQVVG